VKRSSGWLLAALAIASAGAAQEAPPSPVSVEEASAVARHAADGLLRGRTSLFEEAFDRPALVAAAVGSSFAARLTARQRSQLENTLLQAIAGTLVQRPNPQAAARILSARARNGEVVVTLLLPGRAAALKTDWRLKPRHGEWKIEDIVVADAARSLREEAVESLGPLPVASLRRQRTEARQAVWPRLLGILAVFLVAAIFVRHLQPKEKPVLLVVAAAPAILFALDGALAVIRIYREPVAVRFSPNNPRLAVLRRFQEAIARREPSSAKELAAEAYALGARPQPLDLELGELYAEMNNRERATDSFHKALLPPRPAPGAWAGLARLALAAGNFDEASADLDQYIAATTPDPAVLSLKAIALAQNRDFVRAQVCLEEALDLEPLEPALFDLSARIAAAAGDAEIAVSRLRSEEKLRPIDRQSLAQDPAYRGLAGKAVWDEFLSEKKEEPRPPA
jgi:Flp pilus assembly protein TadD